jgi:hypothetical protein
MIESNRISYPMNSLSAAGHGKQGKVVPSSMQTRDDPKDSGVDFTAAQKKQVVMRLIEYIKAS